LLIEGGLLPLELSLLAMKVFLKLRNFDLLGTINLFLFVGKLSLEVFSQLLDFALVIFDGLLQAFASFTCQFQLFLQLSSYLHKLFIVQTQIRYLMFVFD
jgi:hypothetical protein